MTASEDPWIETQYGDGLTVETSAFGDEMEYLVTLESTSGAAALFGLTAEQARVLAARLVGQAMKLEENSTQDWVEGAITVGRILFPKQRSQDFIDAQATPKKLRVVD